MFLVVEFLETKTVNIIAESWFEDGVTWWPNYSNDERINRAVQKCEEPRTGWKQYDVRVLSRTGDYRKAREKLRASLTCNTSELQTDDEEEVIRKRKIKPRHVFGDTDSDNELEVGKKRRCSSISSAPAPPIPPPTPDIPSDSACQTSTGPLLNLSHTEYPCFTTVPPAPITTLGMPSSPLHHFSIRHSEHGRYTAPVHAVTTPISHMPSSSMSQVSATPISEEHQDHSFNPRFRLGRTGTGPIPCSAAQLHILTLLEHIKEQQMQLAAIVNNLAARMATDTVVAEMPPNISLPLATMSEVEELEEWLKDSRNSHAKQNMISALGATGGQNAKRVTWNILSRLFSDAVAKKINWKGVNGKKCFKEMHTRSLLIRAVRKNQSSSGVADSEVDSYTIRWFNLASDRGGGRKERARAKEASTEVKFLWKKHYGSVCFFSFDFCTWFNFKNVTWVVLVILRLRLDSCSQHSTVSMWNHILSNRC
ncbi:uncharacterized protein LOC125739063 isoform X3 [Brienomyrus brachyistius]|nr:uncharacterized protein LOC125739063 isoform X3 [Brienomyrus brachyistius]